MKTMTLLRGGAAACAVSGVLALATPGFAQQGSNDYGSYRNPGQVSTPAEQEQTEQLNQQAVRGTDQSPAALNGAAYGDPQATGYEAQSESQAYGAPNDPRYQNQPAGPNGPYDEQSGPYNQPSAQQQQYDSQMQQYGQQQQQYRDQKQQYNMNNAQYGADLRAYDRATYDWQYPASIEYRYGDNRGLRRLYLIAEPSQQLSEAPVEGPDGRWVGRVRNVETAPDGRPRRVEIALNRRVSVWVRPGDLRYDAGDHVLFTDLTRRDLWQMPGATVESGPL
ncbi:MAG TPA: hypothetical protein VII49_12445 [Rhizomicrobium sp.]